MSQVIIFCEHAIETLTYFSKQLAHAFQTWGYEIFWIDFQKLGLSAWKMRQALQNKKAVLVTFNFIGLSGEEELWDLDDEGNPKTSIWEKMDILCLNIMVDHPIYYYKALKYPLPQMQAFCIDRDHVVYMKRFYPKVRCSFLPLAGNESLSAQVQEEQNESKLFEQWINRPYSLVFTANYIPVSKLDQKLHEMEPEYCEFYYEIIDALIQNPKLDLLSCIETYLRREMPGLDEAGICSAMSTMPAVDLWIRTYFREKTVRTLAEGGIKIHIFGRNWEQISCRHSENIISIGHMVDSAACVQAAANARLALNTMPWFKDGVHDRILTAMLHDTAALTDDSVYLREQFQDRKAIAYYDLQNLEQLPQQVSELLKDPQRLFQIARCGKSVAKRFHTWKCRAEVLKEQLS